MILHEKTDKNKLLSLSIVFVILILISVNFSAFKSQLYGQQQTQTNIRSASINTELLLFLNGVAKNNGEMINVDMDDIINITVFYRDNETGTHIPNATVELLGWGILNETNNQYYNITINANDLDLGFNTLYIVAEKENYQPQIIQFQIMVTLIVGIICRADGGDLLEVYVGDDVVLNIILKDSSNNTIKGAIVIYTWEYGLGELYDPDNDGIYNGTLLTVRKGNYKITIIAIHDYYSFEEYELIMIVITPPPFMLISNADIPDTDGSFILMWNSFNGADNYSIYQFDKYIMELNGSLTPLAEEITDLSLFLNNYSDGIYYFIVVAHCDFGDTLSNCIQVIVLRTKSSPRISGYNLLLMVVTLNVIAVLVFKKKIK